MRPRRCSALTFPWTDPQRGRQGHGEGQGGDVQVLQVIIEH